MALTDPQIVKAANTCLKSVAPAIDVLKNFAFNASDEFATPGTTVKIPVASVGTLAAFASTNNNFEKNDGSITWESVALEDPIKATWEIAAADLTKMNVGAYLDTFAKASAEKIQKYISTKIGNLFDSATTLADNKYDIPALADLTIGDVAALRTKATGRVSENVLLLNSDYYSKVLSMVDNSVQGVGTAITNGYIEKLFGFAAVVECPDIKSGTVGAILPKNDLVIVSRNFQVADPSCYSEYGYEADPETGFAITMMKHGSAATGAAYLNSVALFGVKLINTNEIKILV